MDGKHSDDGDDDSDDDNEHKGLEGSIRSVASDVGDRDRGGHASPPPSNILEELKLGGMYDSTYLDDDNVDEVRAMRG